MPLDTKPESEQDWGRQSSLKLHWVAVFHLSFPFTWIRCHNVPPWSSNKAPLHTQALGSCKAGSIGHLGSGNPPRGHRGGAAVPHPPPQPSSDHNHFILRATAFLSRGTVEQGNRAWQLQLSECPLHGEPQRHRGCDTALLQAQSLWI